MKRLTVLAFIMGFLAIAGCSTDTTGITLDPSEDGFPITEDVVEKPDSTPDDTATPADVTVKDSGDPEDDSGTADAGNDATTDDSLVIPEDQIDVEDGGTATDTGKDEETQPPEVSVGTFCDFSTATAGVPTEFECIVTGLPEGSYVTYLAIGGPANVEVDDLAVTFEKVGKYSVACRAAWAQGEVEDPSPLKIQVVEGDAATIETSLSENHVMAGATVMVSCLMHDAFGNLVEKPAKVAVDPQYGLDVVGMKILASKAGTYGVACVEPTTMLVDPTPETLVVDWGMPKKITTTLESNSIVAGTTTEVACAAEDAYGNKVPDYPVAVFLSPGLYIDVFAVGGTTAGTYQVICVPATDPWDLFILEPRVLTVMHGPPTGVSLQPVPAKPVYKMFESVEFIVSAVDDFGNMVPDIELLPITYDPPDPGIIPQGEMQYKFETEGVFLFSACLTSNPAVCGTSELTVDGYGPVITIKFPSRGVTLEGKPSVAIVGNVVDPVSGVSKFTINNNYVPLDENGDFVYPINAKQGLNMIVAIAEDPNGFKTLLVQSFYYSPVWHKVDINDPQGSQIMDSLQVFLADDFFDKPDHTKPDNLSTIMEMALVSLDLGSFLPNPVAEAGPYKVYVGPFSYDKPRIHIFPRPGGIQALIWIDNISIGIAAKGSCKVLFIDFCPDVSGDVEIDQINVIVGLDIGVQNGQVVSTVSESKAFVYGIDVDISGIIGFLFGWLVNWIIDSYTPTIQDMINDMMKDQLETIMGGLMEALAMNMQFEVPNPLDPTAPAVELSLVSTLQKLTFDQDGVEVHADAAILGAKNINKNPLGSIGRASCLKWTPEEFLFTKWEEYALIAFHDDLINEILFSAWYSGLLDLYLPLEDFMDMGSIGDLGFGDLEDFGIGDIAVRTEFFLPPIITSCNLGEDLFEMLQFQIGDLYVELTMKMLSEPVTVGMFVSMAAEAEIELVDGPNGSELTMGIGEIDPMVAQITYISDNLAGAEGFMSMIIQGLVLPTLLDSLANNSLASIPLPEINLSELAPGYLPGGIVWKFVVDSFFRELGYTVMKAHVELP